MKPESDIRPICRLLLSIILLVFASSLVLGQEYWEYKILGDRYFYLQDYAKAIEYYQQALAKKKDYPEVYYRLGQIYKIQKIFDISLYYYGQALQYKNKFEVKEMEIQLYYEIAEVSFYKKKYDSFMTTLTMLLEKDRYYSLIGNNYYKIINSVPNTVSIYGKGYFWAGYYYFFSGAYDKAVNFFLFSRIYKYKEDLSYWLISKIFFIIGDKLDSKKYEELSYSLNHDLAIFDVKNPWMKIPLDKTYILTLEKYLNEFNGYYYLQ